MIITEEVPRTLQNIVFALFVAFYSWKAWNSHKCSGFVLHPVCVVSRSHFVNGSSSAKWFNPSGWPKQICFCWVWFSSVRQRRLFWLEDNITTVWSRECTTAKKKLKHTVLLNVYLCSARTRQALRILVFCVSIVGWEVEAPSFRSRTNVLWLLKLSGNMWSFCFALKIVDSSSSEQA